MHRCLELEDSQRFEMEYTQQLLLSCLLDITGHLTSNGENINGEGSEEIETHNIYISDQYQQSISVININDQCLSIFSLPI